ncbi:sensor domain-containing protein [Marinospirillum minutulum]|uniref:sensor domain-containing protein n=1 Tax=Marinospirillum minutulum TaxID=64974 RepID=UPI0004081350|nr:EAL domain-containing protein [Marinospirillum minutulum]
MSIKSFFSKNKLVIYSVFTVLAFFILIAQAIGQGYASQLPESFFDEYGSPMLIIDPKTGAIRDANKAAAKFYGYTIEQLKQLNIQKINALDSEDVKLERELAEQENRNYFVFPHRLASGEVRTVEVYSWPLKTDKGERLLFSVILDITGKKIAEASVLEYKDRLESLAESRYQQLVTTQGRINQIRWITTFVLLVIIAFLVWNIFNRRKAEHKLREKTTMLEGLLNSIPEMIFFKNKEGQYLGCNSEFANFVNHTPASVLGKTDFNFFAEALANKYRKADQQVVETRDQVRLEEWTRFPDGSDRLLDKIKAPLLDANNQFIGVLGISRDITEHYQHKQRIEFLAYYDPLTNLPNRYLFQEKLLASAKQLKAGKALMVLAIIDLDHFKNINDALGHTKGDELLIAISKRLNGLLQPKETLARFGGDEFVLLLIQEDSDLKLAEQKLEERLEVFQSSLTHPLRLGENEYLLGCSLGASFNSDFTRSFTDLLKEADIALYAAKEAGRGTWRRFKASMQTQVENRFELEGELRKGLESQQLRLYLQPKTKLNGVVYGTESLVRWEHPEKGLIPPDQFIPLAEDTGMIIPLGEWVLKETLLLMKANPSLTFAVNISPRQFRNCDFVERVQQLIDETGADPKRLTLEVTEGLLITDFNQSSKRMLELQKLGISFSIDDFGTGYSSLSYLKKLPINELKIDRSFVDGLPDDSSDALLIETMMAVAKHLNLLVVAEGVETKEQQAYLYSVGCNHHQGYFYGKPEPANQLLARLK